MQLHNSCKIGWINCHHHFSLEQFEICIVTSGLFSDVVVGAPYEDDMTGAIYVFNGCKTGVWPHFSQRMSGKRFGLTSFGISFSKPIDLNGDQINGKCLSKIIYIVFVSLL